jgi:hypothetical protein
MTEPAPDKPIDKLQLLLQKGERVLGTHRPNPPSVLAAARVQTAEFSEWRTQSLSFLTGLLGSNHVCTVDFEAQVKNSLVKDTQRGIGILRGVVEDLPEILRTTNTAKCSLEGSALSSLALICERFHLVASQLRARHDSRPTLKVEDEYDVQDLLHGLLWLNFEDVRAEEWTPSYAGSSSRTDFLLKRERIVIEVKKTRRGLGSKELGNQLTLDIAHYASHPDCKALVCFVYDPERRISNPRGIESDLSKNKPLTVKVFIRPT